MWRRRTLHERMSRCWKPPKSQQAAYQTHKEVRKLPRGPVEERPGVPELKTRSKSIKTEKEVEDTIPKGLLGPSSAVSVQTEGIYTKAILDTGSQVTLLYRSFYDRYLMHLPLTPNSALQIMGSQSCRLPVWWLFVSQAGVQGNRCRRDRDYWCTFACLSWPSLER